MVPTHCKKIPAHSLELFSIGFNPSVRPETIHVLSKDLFVTMKDPCIDTDNCAFWEMDTGYCVSARWDIPFKDESHGGMDAECFIDNCGAFSYKIREVKLSC